MFFWGAGVQQAEFAHINRLAQDAGRHVGYQRHVSGIGEFGVLCAVDGVVQADMEVICVFGKGRGIQFRDIGEGFVFGGSDHIGLAVAGGFFVRLGCPL